jgi:hypothetical protein
MAVAVLAGYAAMIALFAVFLAIIALASIGQQGLAKVLAETGDIFVEMMKQVALPVFGMAVVFGIATHHVLWSRGRDAERRWYEKAGALLGGAVLMSVLWTDLKPSVALIALSAAVGALFGAVNGWAFGTVLRGRGTAPRGGGAES